MTEVDQIVSVALAPKIDRAAFIDRLAKDAEFIRSFLAMQGNEYLSRVPVIISEIQMEKDARQGAIA